MRARSLAGAIGRAHVWQALRGFGRTNGSDVVLPGLLWRLSVHATATASDSCSPAPTSNPDHDGGNDPVGHEFHFRPTTAGYGAGRSSETALVGFQSFIRWPRRIGLNQPGRIEGCSIPQRLQNSTRAAGAGVRGVFGFNSGKRRRETKEGFRIGKYVLGKELGKGGFGMVRLAQNVVTGEQVAIKIMIKKTQSQTEDQAMQERLMLEIAAMMAVRHPNVVRLHEVMGSRYHVYLVMEYLPGGTLFQKTQQNRLPEDEARAYFHQLIDAVTFCHRKGVVHRDLKPENLLLDAQGKLKVADFGLSGMMSVAGPGHGQQTKFSSVVGTTYYMAPEMIVGWQSITGVRSYHGPPVDIWACGVILFQLLCGVLPFDDEIGADGRLITMQEKIATADYHVPYGVSVPARKLIRRMLDPLSATRITATGIYKNEWFKVNYRPPDFREIQEVKASLEAVESAFQPAPGAQSEHESDGPASMNAFELLSQSAPVDLSPLVERRPGDTGAMEETRLTSRLPAPDILRQMQAAALSVGLSVQVKGFRMKLDAQASSPKEPLSIVGEVFELPGSEMFMVILRKVTGDSQDCKRAFGLLCKAVRTTMVEIKTR